MTLIEVRGGDGRLIGRCDARCYGATSSTCQCVCGGHNHGKGLRTAAKQTAELADRQTQRTYAAADGNRWSFKAQRSLFDEAKDVG